MLILDVRGLHFGFIFSFETNFSFAFDKRDACDVFPPTNVEGSLDAMRACNVLPDGGPIDVATGITQVGNLGEGELQGTVLMNEPRHSIPDEPDGRDEPHGKCGRRWISPLTRYGLTLAAVSTGISEAIRVNSASVARLSQNAGRDKCRLVHSIYGYKRVRH